MTRSHTQDRREDETGSVCFRIARCIASRLRGPDTGRLEGVALVVGYVTLEHFLIAKRMEATCVVYAPCYTITEEAWVNEKHLLRFMLFLLVRY